MTGLRTNLPRGAHSRMRPAVFLLPLLAAAGDFAKSPEVVAGALVVRRGRSNAAVVCGTEF